MADFCRDCAIDTWGFDTKDLAGLGIELDISISNSPNIHKREWWI